MSEAIGDFLFDTPLWLFGVLSVLAIGLLVSGNRRQDRRLLTAGFSLLAVEIVLAALSYFVETDKEKCVRLTREVVKAVESRDADKFGAFLDPQVTFVHTEWDKQSVVEEAKAAAERFGLKDVSFGSASAQRVGPQIDVTFSVVTHHDPSKAYVDTVPSSWRFTWVNGPDGWQLKTIDPVRIGNEDGNRIGEFVGGGRR